MVFKNKSSTLTIVIFSICLNFIFFVSPVFAVTPTPTPCPFGVSCPGQTATPTPTRTPPTPGSPTPTNTPTNSYTPTATNTFTNTPTATNTPVPGATSAPTDTPTPTPSVAGIPSYSSLMAICNNGDYLCLATVNDSTDPNLCQTGAQAGLKQIIAGTTDPCTAFVPAGGAGATVDSPPAGTTLQARCLCGSVDQYVTVVTYSAAPTACTSLTHLGLPCIFNGLKVSQ